MADTPSFDQSTPTIPVTRSVQFPGDVEATTRGAIKLWPQERVYQYLEADERVIMVIGRHWITRIFPFVLGCFFGLVPVVGIIASLVLLGPGTLLKFIIVLTWFWLCFVFYYFISLFLTWRSDLYIITNERIIDIDANSVAYKRALDVDLSHVYDVRQISGGGLIRGGIDYGDVTVELMSGNKREMKMRNIPMPAQVALAIGELAEAARSQEEAHGGVAAVAAENQQYAG